MKKTIVVLACLLFFTSCSSAPIHNDIYVQEKNALGFESKFLLNTQKYRMVYNDMIDTYFIACGLYFDFSSDYLFPQTNNNCYQETIEFFSPYKNHIFIEDLEQYLDIENKYTHLDVLYYLSQYIISKEITGMDIMNIDSEIFATDDDFYIFIDNLYNFYIDTSSNDFFKQSSLHKTQLNYFSEHKNDILIDELLSNMENYVGNKSSLFGNASVEYYSFISAYKSSNNANYSVYGMGDSFYLTSTQSPFDFNNQFSIIQVFETSMHEFLHSYINQSVEDNQSLIQSLTTNLEPKNYTSPIYLNMPWYRIVDEAIVRVVLARIYGLTYSDYELAYDKLIVKELESGIANLDIMYYGLENYENNHDTYTQINDYIEALIDIYLSN